jgi:hypothetical protein
MRNQSESRPLAIGLTVLSALGRLMPHFPNVTPVGGSCLFAGSKVSGLLAYLLPLVVMGATDPFMHEGSYSWTSIAVYSCFLINVWIGRRMLRSVTPMRVGAAAFLCSAQFFLLTNFALWFAGGLTHSPWHTPGLAGLLSTYALGLPFWGRTLAGDLFFSAALFAMYGLLARRMERVTPETRELSGRGVESA